MIKVIAKTLHNFKAMYYLLYKAIVLFHFKQVRAEVYLL